MCAQWFGILQITEHYAFDAVRELWYRELFFLANQADSDTDQDTDSGPDQSVYTTSQFTVYHLDSDNALPRPAQAAPLLTTMEEHAAPLSPSSGTVPVCIPHPNHPYSVDQNGLPYIMAHSTNWWIGLIEVRDSTASRGVMLWTDSIACPIYFFPLFYSALHPFHFLSWSDIF